MKGNVSAEQAVTRVARPMSAPVRAFRRRPSDRRRLGAQGGLLLDLPRPDRAEAEARLDRFLGAVDREVLPAFSSFAVGVRQWREERLAYFDEPTTNGDAEGVIHTVKVIKRRAYGLPSFESFRRRVLVACG